MQSLLRRGQQVKGHDILQAPLDPSPWTAHPVCAAPVRGWSTSRGRSQWWRPSMPRSQLRSRKTKQDETVHLLCHCHLSFISRTTPLLVYDINDMRSHTNRTSYMQYGLKKTTGLYLCLCVVLSSTLNKLWIFMSYFSKQYGFNTGSVISCGWIVSYSYRQYGSFHRKFISCSFACVVFM